MRKILLIASLVAIFSAQGYAKKLSVRFATVAPRGTPWADTIEQIKKDVEKESNKSIKIKPFLGGQLGGELEILAGIRRGRIQGGGLTSAALGSVIPEMNVLEIPFIFETYEEADYVLDKFLLKPFKEIFEAKGLIFVSWAENGWRNIGLKEKVVKKASDLKGIKVRSQESTTHLAFWEKVGAQASAIAVPEVLSALQTGVVEGFDNTALFTLAAEWHTGIKFYSVTQHIYQPAAVVYSKKFWGKLKDDQKKILIGKGNNMAAPSRKAVRSLGTELLEVLKGSGITVYKLTKAERAAFKAELTSVEKSVVGKLGGRSKEIYDLVNKGKQEYRTKMKK